MEKKRFEKGEKYWCVGEDMNPLEAVCGENWALDVLRFEADNCYTDYHECYVMCGKLRAVLKGSDVIEMPESNEVDMIQREIGLEVGGEDEELVGAASLGAIRMINWLIDKIVK